MLSAILLAAAGQAPPRFKGAPVSLAPSLTERFEAIGFADGDRLLVKQTFMDSRFFIVDSRGGARPVPETVNGRRVTDIKVQDGFVKGVSMTRDSRTAVFKLDSSAWRQIGGLSLYFCTEAFENSSGEVVGYGFEEPGNPFGVYFWDGKQLANVSRRLKLPDLKVHSFWEDGSVVLSSWGAAGGAKLTLLRKDGVLLLGETVDARDFKVFSIPEKAEVIVDPKSGPFAGVQDSSMILSQGVKRTLKGPAGRALRGVRGNGQSYVGTEPVPVGDAESRAVLIFEGRPFYLDELVDNKELLGASADMINGFEEAVDISRSGMIVVHARVQVKNGGSAKRAFILKPVIEAE
jgi:hypothetical protein